MSENFFRNFLSLQNCGRFFFFFFFFFFCCCLDALLNACFDIIYFLFQVVRPGEKRSFFSPAQYLKLIDIAPDQMKQTIRQGWSSQKVSGSQNSNENVTLSRPQGLSLSSQDNKTNIPVDLLPSPSSPFVSQSYMTKIETNRIAVERTDPYPMSRPSGISSFKSESPVPSKGLHRNGSNESVSSTAYSLGCAQQVSQESSSSHTSKSSLNEGSRCSTESLSQSHVKKHQVVKAASHDELSSGDRCRSSLDISQPRAASSEGLDGNFYSRDYMLSNQLSYRHRSNSVDFRIFQKELSFSEIKHSSLDKSRKPRISKNRRRSWAVEERQIQENHRSAYYKKGDTLDSSIILDVPPKLPPKQRKNRPTDIFCSSSENVGKLEGPIDVKIQEVKCSKPPPPSSAPNVKCLNQDYDGGGLRPDPNRTDFSDQRRRGIVDSQDAKDFPVALPRKNLPPQLSSFDIGGQSGGNVVLSQSASEMVSKDNNGNQLKREDNVGISNNNAIDYGSFTRKIYDDSDERRKIKKSDSFGRVPKTPDMLRKLEKSSEPYKRTFVCHESSRDGGYSDASVQLILKGCDETSREEEKENEDRYPPRETPTPDSSRAGKLAYQVSVRRMLIINGSCCGFSFVGYCCLIIPQLLSLCGADLDSMMAKGKTLVVEKPT